MATEAAGEFEKALGRLEEIVRKLDEQDVDLDESVRLFKEGKALAQRCERLLADAQAQVEAASRAHDDPSGAAPGREP